MGHMVKCCGFDKVTGKPIPPGAKLDVNGSHSFIQDGYHTKTHPQQSVPVAARVNHGILGGDKMGQKGGIDRGKRVVACYLRKAMAVVRGCGPGPISSRLGTR